ncbi:MAG TPA: hypothetical protein VIW29_01135 [Polyangiaceae bacterium]
MPTPRRLAICPYHSFIEPACERGLAGLERRGWMVWRRPGSAAIDRERSRLATAALDEGYDALLWVDSDQDFEPEAADALDDLGVPFVSALIARRGVRDFACVFDEATGPIGVGTAGSVVPVRYVGAGFALVRRVAFEAVQAHFALPRILDAAGAIVPFYLPMVTEVTPGRLGYLGEDFAFCERLRRARIDVLVDTRLRIGHIGRYTYQWEDVLQPTVRVDGAELAINAKQG